MFHAIAVAIWPRSPVNFDTPSDATASRATNVRSSNATLPSVRMPCVPPLFAALPSLNLDQLLFRLTTHTTRPTTTATSRIGTQAPPYPPIQALFHMLPFIMYPDWAETTPVVNRGTLPTATASKVFICVP